MKLDFHPIEVVVDVIHHHCDLEFDEEPRSGISMEIITPTNSL